MQFFWKLEKKQNKTFCYLLTCIAVKQKQKQNFRLRTNFRILLMSSPSSFLRMLYVVLFLLNLHWTFLLRSHFVEWMIKFQVALPFQYLLCYLWSSLFLPHLSKLSITGYSSSLYRSIFSGCVCPEHQCCGSSLWGIAGCSFHWLAGKVAMLFHADSVGSLSFRHLLYLPLGAARINGSYLRTLSRWWVPCNSLESRQAVCSLPFL